MTIHPIPEPEDQDFHHPGADEFTEKCHEVCDLIMAMRDRNQISEISAIYKTAILSSIVSAILAELGGCPDAGKALH
jgi:hypothetical protein